MKVRTVHTSFLPQEYGFHNQGYYYTYSQNTSWYDGLVFKVSRLTLTFPFTGDFKFSEIGAFVSFALLLVIGTTFACFQMAYFAWQWESKSNAALAGEFPELIFLILNPHVNIILMFVRRDDFENIFSSLAVIGERKAESILMGFNALCLSEYYLAYSKKPSRVESDFVVANLSYVFFYWLHSLQLIQIISVLRSLEKGFERCCGHGRNRQVQLDIREHSEFLELTRCVSRAYGPSILLNLALIFLKIVTHAFLLFSRIVLITDGEKAFHHATQLSYILVEFVALMGCVQRVRVQAEAFNNELFKLMRDSKDLCSNNKLRLCVTMKQTVNFTACGFFSLGYPLVTSIIAAATTYLVILIQFSLLTS